MDNRILKIASKGLQEHGSQLEVVARAKAELADAKRRLDAEEAKLQDIEARLSASLMPYRHEFPDGLQKLETPAGDISWQERELWVYPGQNDDGTGKKDDELILSRARKVRGGDAVIRHIEYWEVNYAALRAMRDLAASIGTRFFKYVSFSFRPITAAEIREPIVRKRSS